MAKENTELKQYKITFTGEGGDIVLVHNFKQNVYQRNVEAPINELYLDVVKNSVIETEVADANGKKRMVKIPTHPYILGD